MSRREQVTEELRNSLNRGAWNALWRSQRALASLPSGVDPRLVDRAMRLAFGRRLCGVCGALREEYVPLALRVISTLSTPEAAFVRELMGQDTSGAGLKAAASRLRELELVHHDRPRPALPRLDALIANGAVLAAAQATVAQHGIDSAQHLAVLARDGSAESVDVLMPIVKSAIERRGSQLDELSRWLTPFAKGAYMAEVCRALDAAIDARGEASELHELKRRLGGRGDRVSIDFHVESADHKALAWIVLQSHGRPAVKLFITRNRGANFDAFSWEDGVARPPSELVLRGPSSLDDLPSVLAQAAKTLKTRWAPRSVRLTSTLRGRSRERLVAWLLGGR